MNPLFFYTLILALVLYAAGKRLSREHKRATLIIGVIAAIPGLLMALYYLHLFDKAAWYYEFRSWPYIELSAAGLGFAFGALMGKSRKQVAILGWSGFLLLLLALPYIKPILRPLPLSIYIDRWKEGVCLQSTRSSCGAASAASVLKTLGIDGTEKELAKECFTYRGGTENWYIARALRRRGCSVQFRIEDGFPKNPKLPLVAGVKVRKFGHFVAILRKTDGVYVCADPLVGLERVPEADIRKHFRFTGFLMEVGKSAE